MTAAELTDQTLLAVRREFYRGNDKGFFQERNLLVKAITYPADWLNRKGAKLPAAKYRAILQTVLDAMKRHADRAAIRRVSAYFLHAVQEHMKHHGEEYYLAAKQLRPAGVAAQRIVGKLRPGDVETDIVGVMLEVRRTLRSKGGRKKQSAEAQLGLI